MEQKSKLPNILIAGVPKSGTTSLYKYLKEHPDIFLPYQKEIHFFSSSRIQKLVGGKGDKEPASRICNNLEDYQKHYKNVGKEKAIVDVSPSYFFHAETSILNIKKYLSSDVKIIVLLRDPIERAFSNYLHKLRLFNEPLSFAEAIEIEDERISQGYGDFWYYKSHSLYFDKLSLFLTEFGEKQVKVILFEDLKVDPLKICHEIFQFIGVDDTFCPENTTTVYNKGVLYEAGAFTKFLTKPNQNFNKFKSTLKKILPVPITTFIKDKEQKILKSKQVDKPTMTNRSIETLKTFFKNDVLALKNQHHINVTKWKYFNDI